MEKEQLNMVNITHKVSTLRKAKAEAVLTISRMETMEAVRNRTVPKGDVLECARAAGLLAVKKTSDVIPDCHPLPIEFASITYRLEDLTIIITAEVHTIYKTGVEVEAMHGASVAALTIYDMLKPLDKEITINHIRLVEKKGGKTDYSDQLKSSLRCAVVVCSDSIHAGSKQDFAGKAVMEKLKKNDLQVNYYEIIPDEDVLIKEKAMQLSGEQYDLVLFCGGTGLSRRDVTPEAIRPLFSREIPGIMEAARQYGQQRTPYAMLSRGVAGFIDQTLVLTLPGSTRGAEETMDALFPYLLHVFRVAAGMRHDEGTVF